MKVFIALALVSVALAIPVIEPVQLPAAPLPAMEAMPYAPMPEPIDIRPAFVPVEVLQALRLQEIPSEILAEVAHVDTAFEALKVVNLDEVIAPFAEEIPAEPVKIVEVAEYIEVAPSAAEEVAVPSGEEIPAEAVNVVEIAENIETEVVADELAATAEEIPAEAVKVVEVAENIETEVVADEVAATAAAEEIPAEAVKVVEVAENIETEVVADEVAATAAAAEEIPAEAVKVVEVAENIEAEVANNNVESVAQDVVRVVDAPLRHPGKVYDNPMLR